MSDRRELTGIWYGRWSSPNGYVPPNTFIATLTERATLVAGAITERHRDWPDVIRANVHGVRAGGRVEFTKQYDGNGPLSHAVYYSGSVNGAGTEVRGGFRFGAYSGDFTMTREKFDADELENVEEIKERVPEKTG